MTIVIVVVVLIVFAIVTNAVITAENLDNQGDDREKGSLDVYTDVAQLEQCATVVRLTLQNNHNQYCVWQAHLDSDPVTLKLTITNPELTEFTDWFVEFVDITVDQKEESTCEVNSWLDMPQ